MGEVYLAEDTKLDRKVAIKFLHEEFSKDTDKLNRFIQEAKAASALNHPNILTVYEIGEVDGKNYIATELIDGQTLREHLSQTESLQLNTILKIGVQVSEALSAAHQAGIIHRDIKPENIMLRRDGYAKVLDFGLAKLSEQRGAGETGGHGDAGTRGHGDAGTGGPGDGATRGHGDAGTGGRGAGATGSDGESNTLIAASPRLPIPASPCLPIPASPRPPVPGSVNTTPGLVMGTVSYMSPEQARGKETDARTDIWSLGVVLYEMLSGKVPFTGETINHTIVSILEKEPLLLENVPAELQRIVRKAMTKDVEMRYQSARDLLIDLKNLRRELDIQGELERSIVPNRETLAQKSAESETQFYTGSGKRTASGQMAATQNVTTSSSSLEYAVTQAKSHKLATAVIGIVLIAVIATVGYFAVFSRAGGGQINSIAVMPFINESGNADLEYLSDGMTETLIKGLTSLPMLNVKPRSSVFRYKGKDTDLQTIGRELNVQVLLNGRVAQRGDQLTLSLELVDVQNDKVLWTEQYQRKQSELVSLQSEIAKDVSNHIKSRLSGSEERSVTKAGTSDPEAYQAYLKGRYYWNRRTSEDINKAIEQFKIAADIDPNYALAFAGLGDCYAVLSEYSGIPNSETVPKAQEYAERAIAIDPQLAEPHATLASNYQQSWQWSEAEKAYKRAIEINPNYPTAYHWYSLLLKEIGRNREAEAAIRRAYELDPLSSVIGINIAELYLQQRNFDASIETCRKIIEIAPTYPAAYEGLAVSYMSKRMFPDALVAAEKAAELSKRAGVTLGSVGHVFAVAGERAKAIAIVKELEDKYLRREASGFDIASVYAGLGDKDKAFDWLEKDFRTRNGKLQQIRWEVEFEPLRNDPRFRDLLRRMNLPE